MCEPAGFGAANTRRASASGVWLDVTFENLTEHALQGFRVGSATVIDPAGLRRLRDYDGRHVNRMIAGSWGGGTDGPVRLAAFTRTTMVMGDANNQPLVLPFEARLTGKDIAVKAHVGGHGCTFVASPD